LQGAVLQSVNLTNANLTLADLTDASLAEANLHHTNLRKAILQGTDLSDARHVTGQQLRDAALTENMKPPATLLGN
jgi:uncharacterized protein YjbI with pentapeptide repeats